MKKRIIAVLLAASMVLNMSVLAFSDDASAAAESIVAEVENNGSAEQTEALPVYDISTYDSSTPVWNTDMRIGITREYQLVRESGHSFDEWDDLIKKEIAEGLADPVTRETLLSSDPEAKICEEDGKVYFLGANDAFPSVMDTAEAYRLAYSLTDILGFSEKTDLMLWSRLTVNDMTIYSFQQLIGTEEVLGKTMKIAVDADGTVSAVFNSLDPESVRDEDRISGIQAEEVVRKHLEEEGKQPDILSDYTERTIHAMSSMNELQITDDDPIPDQVLWIVYTPNDSEEGAAPEEVPYLAHYVGLDGSYQYSLPVKEPGCVEALNGYPNRQVFENMTADSFRTQLTDEYNRTFDVIIPVMYNEEEGQWYLGDVNRRIVLADHNKLAYTPEHELELISSSNNEDWDIEDVWAMYNYIRAWDFYAAMGWIGPDGQGTDVMILKNLTMVNGAPYENACSVGKIENWQMFGYSGYNLMGEPLKLVRGLDVMAHEYTHTFTSTVMNNNLYENDLGAINEAMSDIMGNLVEYIYHDTQDNEKWLLGEQTGNAIRSMSEPNDFQQPDYVWDKFYGPSVTEPNTVNDRGGVHANSSLLNRIAALLCLEGGMPLERAAEFWVTVAAGLTPETDYPQIVQLLRWAIVVSGEDTYADKLEELIEEEQLTLKELPEEINSDHKLVVLQLPDTETFRDPNWALLSFQFNADRAVVIGKALFSLFTSIVLNPGDAPEIASALEKLVNSLKLDKSKLDLGSIKDILENEEAIPDAITDVLFESTEKLLTQSLSWEEMDSDQIPLMIETGNPTAYCLINLVDSGATIQGLAVLIGEHWYDLSSFIKSTSMFDLRTIMESQSKAQASTQSEAEPASEAEAEVQSEAEPAPEAEVEVQSEAEPAPEAETEVQSEAETQIPDQSSEIEEVSQELTMAFLQLIDEFVENTKKDREKKKEENKDKGIISELFSMLSTGIEYVGSYLSDEEEPEFVKLQPKYLPTDGLEKVQLIKKESDAVSES